VRIGVPVHVENREASPGVKKGGAVNIVRHTVEVMAPADDIPEAITVDLTGLDFHDSVHLSALKLPNGCKAIASKSNVTVVTIVPPTLMAEDETAAAAAAPAADAKAAPAKGGAAAPAKGAAAPAKGAAAPAKGAAPAAAKPAAKPAAKK